LLQGAAGGGSASAPASPGDVIQMDAQISTHCGVPYTASLLAFDSVQRLLAVATL
jgi:syntaxin-binding protein 5